MANLRINDLTAAATLTGAELVEVEQDDTGLKNRKTTAQDIADLGGPDLSDAAPLAAGTADEGTSTEASRADHVHPLPPVPINSQAANYTLVLADAGKVIRATAAADITIPPNSAVAFPVGTVVNVRAAAAGAVGVVEGSGVTVNIPAGFTLDLAGQWSEVSLHKVAADTWDGVGGWAEDAS